MANTDVTKMAFFAVTDPKLLTIDPETVGAEGTKRAWEVIKQNDAKNAEKTDKRKEYNQLRQQLYNLQQYAKSNEVNCNNKADTVKLLEQRINDLLKQKKEAIERGHLGDERICEHRIQLLETELIDAREAFTKAKHGSTQAARALRAFGDPTLEIFEETVVDGKKKTVSRFVSGHARIAELKEQLDKPIQIK